MKYGIIGFGRFGKLWADSLLPYGNVLVYDKNTIQDANAKIQFKSLQQVVNTDVLFILVPISEFEKVCQEVSKYVNSKTIIVDCCSVKMYSTNIMKKTFLPEQALIATHPLFGPDSVKKTGRLSGHHIVVCPISNDISKNHIEQLFTDMGLKIFIATPEEHDKQMAKSQCLVHFIGRGLISLELTQQQLSTPDFQALLNINSMVINDKRQLFLDMQKYNPFSKEVRRKFIHELIHIDNEITGEQYADYKTIEKKN